MPDPEWLVELETCRERLTAAERRLSEAAWRVGDGPFPVTHVYNPETGLWDRVRESDVLRLERAQAEVAESRSARLSAALREARQELLNLQPQVASGITLSDNVDEIDDAVRAIEAVLAADDAAGDAHGR